MNQKIVAGLCMLFFATPIIVHAGPMLGTPHNEVSVSASGGAIGIGGDSCGGPVVFGSGPVSTGCAADIFPLPFHAAGSASAGMGVVRLRTEAGATAGERATFGSFADARATLQDFFAISGPANSDGRLQGSIIVGGDLFAAVSGGPASAAASSSYVVQTSFGSFSGSWGVATSGFLQQANISGGVLPVDAPIHFGPDGWAPITFSIHAQLVPYLKKF